MTYFRIAITALIFAGMNVPSFAACDCDGWVDKGGYCTNYIKSRIPTFPLPENHAEAAALVNRETAAVQEGDVAIFHYRNYWHFAYVEKVHRTSHGLATAIDVSEMNFGGNLSFDEFRETWGSNDQDEWKEALCCGITDNYEETSYRRNIPLKTVKQIWSPDVADAGDDETGRIAAAVGKVREVVNRLIDFAERAL